MIVYDKIEANFKTMSDAEAFIGKIKGSVVFVKDSPHHAYKYALNCVGKRTMEYENIIASEPETAYLYARNVICGPWTEGEPAISTFGLTSYLYARMILKDRFPAGEPAILQSSVRDNYADIFRLRIENEGYVPCY